MAVRGSGDGTEKKVRPRGARRSASRASKPKGPLRFSNDVKQQVLLEAGYQCGKPACRNVLTLEIHHIVWVRDGGGNEPENLIPLCPICHSLHTAGYIPEAAIRVWKGMLQSLNNPNRASADILLVLHRNSSSNHPILVSTDGLISLAGLLTAGLLEVTSSSSQISGPSSHSSFRLAITERGRLLVEAWLAGDERQMRDALNAPEAK